MEKSGPIPLSGVVWILLYKEGSASRIAKQSGDRITPDEEDF